MFLPPPLACGEIPLGVGLGEKREWLFPSSVLPSPEEDVSRETSFPLAATITASRQNYCSLHTELQSYLLYDNSDQRQIGTNYCLKNNLVRIYKFGPNLSLVRIWRVVRVIASLILPKPAPNSHKTPGALGKTGTNQNGSF